MNGFTASVMKQEYKKNEGITQGCPSLKNSKRND